MLPQMIFFAQGLGEMPDHLEGFFHGFLTVRIHQAASGRRKQAPGQQELAVNALAMEPGPNLFKPFLQEIMLSFSKGSKLVAQCPTR